MKDEKILYSYQWPGQYYSNESSLTGIMLFPMSRPKLFSLFSSKPFKNKFYSASPSQNDCLVGELLRPCRLQLHPFWRMMWKGLIGSSASSYKNLLKNSSFLPFLKTLVSILMLFSLFSLS